MDLLRVEGSRWWDNRWSVSRTVVERWNFESMVGQQVECESMVGQQVECESRRKILCLCNNFASIPVILSAGS